MLRRRIERHKIDLSATEEQLVDGRWIEEKVRQAPSGCAIHQWTDITEKRKYELRLADVMECTADGFSVWDQSDRLVTFNRKFSQTFSVDGEGVKQGTSFQDLIHTLCQAGLTLDEDGDEGAEEGVHPSL